MQYIEIHNQIFTKSFQSLLNLKSLRNPIYTKTNALNSRAQELDLDRKLSTHNLILLAKD